MRYKSHTLDMLDRSLKNKRTLLIQRAKKEIRDKPGIDGIIKLDYMGSAEFEFGALPDSLVGIRKHLNVYTYLDIPIKEKVVTVFCHSDVKLYMKEYITLLSDNKLKAKDWVAFEDQFNDGYYKEKINFWWDIDNNIMFRMKDNDFEKSFKETIPNKLKIQ